MAVTTTGAITACTLASENTAGSAANAGCAYESTPVVNSQAFKSVKLTTDADTSTTLTPGDTLTYTVQYVNRGNTTINNFQITDLLPTGITFAGPQIVTVSGAGTGATANSGYTGGVGAVVSNLLASGATIASGGVITVTIPVTVNTGFIGSVANQTSGSGTEITSAVLSDNAGLTADLPATVTAAPYSLTIPGSSVSQTIAGTIDLTNFTVAALPKLSLVKSVLPLGVQSPGTDLTYKIIFTNSGNVSAQLLVLSDPIPLNTDFKVGSATTTLGTTGLTVVVEYSYDYTAASPGTATWGTTPAPASGGGGAPPGYDRTVKAIRWRATAGNLSQTSPNNMGDVGFTVKIK